MKCPKCSTPVSFFRSAAMLKTLECKGCGAELQRTTKPAVIVTLVLSGMVATKIISMYMGYWPAFGFVVVAGSIMEWKLSALKLKPLLSQQSEEGANP